MGKLSEWCVGQPAWAVDAMQRAATSAHINDENIEALVSRVALAHDLSVAGDHPCQAFSEDALVLSATQPDDVILQSVGPMQGLDRLAAEQTLKFGLNGLTVVFGDNGSGKSGYTRALRSLCSARVDAALQGDVFSEATDPTKTITYSYKKGDEQPTTATWTEGDPKPDILSAITLLDTDNLRVYIESKSEILYLPPEADCVGRLAELYQAAATRYRGWIDASTTRCTPPYGGSYRPTTSAGRLVARLQVDTTQNNLPSEQDIRQVGVWSPEAEAELAQLGAELVQGPAAIAGRCERVAAACAAAAAAFEAVVPTLTAPITDLDTALIITKQEKQRVAATLVAEQIGAQPIGATGNDAWRELYRAARAFAAEAGVRSADQPFNVGDPCPVCQQAIGDEAAKRLAAFDAFMEGKATGEAQTAATAAMRRISLLRDLGFKADDDLRLLLQETATLSPEAKALVIDVMTFNQCLRQRRDSRVAQLETEQILPLPPLARSPVADLHALAGRLKAEAATLRSSDNRTAWATTRIAELADQKLLHGQVEEVVTRRNELFCLHRYKACEAALNTAPLSRLMTTLRKDLVSPDLKARIEQEIAAFAMTHVPLKFADESNRGTSFFEMELASGKRARKSRVLSEGEQRALSLACFLAECHVAGKRAGIILDDPVTSLDHTRVRRVARRLVEETAKGRQIIIFTHNLVFYHELMLACVDRDAPVPVLPCLIRQGGEGEFGLVTIGDEPWVARKVKDREATLRSLILAIPDDLATGSAEYKRHCTSFYATLRETWERAVEELVLNDVVRRFGSDVGTLRLGGVEVSDDDFTLIHRSMKRASEHSGHDQAAGRQIDMPTKDQMLTDLSELQAFRAIKTKANDQAASRRRALVSGPPRAEVA